MILSHRERNYIRAALRFMEYAATTLPYHPVDHPKIRPLFDWMAPLSEHHVKVLMYKLALHCPASFTMDELVRITGKAKSVIGRELRANGYSVQKVYPDDCLQLFPDIFKHKEFLENFKDDLATPTESESEQEKDNTGG